MHIYFDNSVQNRTIVRFLIYLHFEYKVSRVDYTINLIYVHRKITTQLPKWVFNDLNVVNLKTNCTIINNCHLRDTN